MNIIKKIVLTSLILLFCFKVSLSQTQNSPNIIIIFNDDQGYQDLSCYGSPNIKTPRVDELAKEGMKFTNFYVASPVCSPSRAALLTGQYPQNVGVQGVFFPNTDKGLDPEHTTIAEMLKTKNYNTSAIGKWHLGDLSKYLPTNQGFDSYYGIPYSNDMYPSKTMKYSETCIFRDSLSIEKINKAFEGLPKGKQPKGFYCKVPLMKNEQCIEFPCDQTTITKRFTDEGLKFITKSVEEKKPFFLYLANSMPHIPLYASKDFLGTSERGLYGDVIEEIDFNTGRILDHLKALNIEENTIVIFSSDNGPWLSVGKDKSGSAAPLYEGKFTSFEGGMRVPFVIKWPNKIPQQSVCNELSSTIDIFPTLANIVGAKFSKKGVDGKDVIDLWSGKPNKKTPHKYYYYVYSGKAIRYGDWKYHKKEIYQTNQTKRDFKGPTLYNLKSDIGESKNVINEYPKIAKRLAKALDKYLDKIPPKD